MTATAVSSELATLPALRGLSKLADLRPVIVVDSREQTPLPISRLEVVRAGLQSGDYSFQGGENVFAVERKSIEDLVQCCMGENRERFERECHRRRGFRFKRLLIVGARWMIEGQRYKSKIKPAAVLNSLAAWECRFELPVVFVDHPTQAAELVEHWAWWFAREMVETTNSLLRGQQDRTGSDTTGGMHWKGGEPDSELPCVIMPEAFRQLARKHRVRPRFLAEVVLNDYAASNPKKLNFRTSYPLDPGEVMDG